MSSRSPAKFFLVALGLGLLTQRTPAATPALSAPSAPEYNRDIRPILSDNCFLCHGPDKNTRKAKLRLDIRDEAVRLKAIVPGDAEASSLIKRVFSNDPEEVMPPVESHKRLAPTQRDTLKRWIAAGAPYQPHWAYIAPVRPNVPAVRHRRAVANPIDAFVVSQLEAHGLEPSRETDRQTLLRRLSLDLIGLPPSPSELSAFTANGNPDAYHQEVERLLQSPHYGERMAVPWLDTARFTDTVGYHGDQNQRIFPYRDYVIDAFNHNKRFDLFTAEQLAGDLLPNPTIEQRIATGFNRLNMVTREGGAQPKEYLAKYAADRVRTVAITWLGSTMGCAECHDHKFDPFTSRDFYAMSAFFADIKQWGVYQDYKYTPNPDLKGWSNDHPFPPELEVESEPLKRRDAQLRRQINELFLASARRSSTNDETAKAARRDWEQSTRTFLASSPDGWRLLAPNFPRPPEPEWTTSTNIVDGFTNVTRSMTPPPEPLITAEGNGSIRIRPVEKKEESKVDFTLQPGHISALRLERLPHDNELGTLRLSAALKRPGEKKPTPIRFFRADAAGHEVRYANGDEMPGILEGWRPAARQRDPQVGVWQLTPPLEAQAGDVLEITIKCSTAITARFATSPLAMVDPVEPPILTFIPALLTLPEARTPSDQAVVAGVHLLSTQRDIDVDAFARFRKLDAALSACHHGLAHTLITVATKPPVTRVLPRGNWQNESGEVVLPETPHFLPSPPRSQTDETRLTRLDLARWLVSRENPLTARVFVNRLWKQFFGTGLSTVVDDLGAQGEWPVNPALLDWLAVEFMESGWDVKHMVRLIVESKTYRQSSNLRPELADVDPQNRWLASQNPRRLEAEFVRDNALSVAGLINLELGGPSVHPYQPAGYYANLQFPDRDYPVDGDDRQYRRGVYMHWQRTFLHPMLANFDAPAREECTAQRVVSNTPQQALTLLNDPTFVEASRVFATHLLKPSNQNDQARLNAAYQQAVGRLPRGAESTSLRKFLGEQRAHYQDHRDEATALLKIGLTPTPPDHDPVQLAAWTQVARVILNLHETVTRY